MVSKQLGYLASPYTDPDVGIMDTRADETIFIGGQIVASGRHIFSPIAMCHGMAKRVKLPRDFEFWQHFNKNMIERCDYLVILPIDGWLISLGIRGEVKIAKEFDKPIYIVQFTKEHVFLGYTPYKGELDEDDSDHQ